MEALGCTVENMTYHSDCNKFLMSFSSSVFYLKSVSLRKIRSSNFDHNLKENIVASTSLSKAMIKNYLLLCYFTQTNEPQ